MKKQKSPSRMLAAAVLCLLSSMPVHACAEGGDLTDLPPDVSEGICYVVDFVDKDGELLDSRVCTYGERLEGIQTPDQREVGGRVYRFTGWEPALAETVTESVVYTAVYQEAEGTDGGAGSISGAETEVTGTPEKAASGSRHHDGPQQVSATSYDVTPFHVETVSGMPGVLEEYVEEQIEGPQIAGTWIGDPEKDPDAAAAEADIRKCNEEIEWRAEPEPAVPAEISPVDLGPAEPAVHIEMRRASAAGRAVQKMEETVETYKEEETREKGTPSAVGRVSRETEKTEASSEDLADSLGRDPQKRSQSLPMPQLLLSLAACAGGAWAARRAG